MRRDIILILCATAVATVSASAAVAAVSASAAVAAVSASAAVAVEACENDETWKTPKGVGCGAQTSKKKCKKQTGCKWKKKACKDDKAKSCSDLFKKYDKKKTQGKMKEKDEKKVGKLCDKKKDAAKIKASAACRESCGTCPAESPPETASPTPTPAPTATTPAPTASDASTGAHLWEQPTDYDSSTNPIGVVADPDFSLTAEFRFETTITPGDAAIAGIIAGRGRSGVPQGWLLLITPSRHVLLYLYGATGYEHAAGLTPSCVEDVVDFGGLWGGELTSRTALPVGEETTLVLLRAGNTFELYVDGDLSCAADVTSWSDTATHVPHAVGAYYAPGTGGPTELPFDGKITATKFTEVSANDGTAPTPAPTVTPMVTPAPTSPAPTTPAATPAPAPTPAPTTTTTTRGAVSWTHAGTFLGAGYDDAAGLEGSFAVSGDGRAVVYGLNGGNPLRVRERQEDGSWTSPQLADCGAYDCGRAADISRDGLVVAGSASKGWSGRVVVHRRPAGGAFETSVALEDFLFPIAVALSADGGVVAALLTSRVAAAAWDGASWRSLAPWPDAGSGRWTCMDLSADGSTLVLGSYYSPHFDNWYADADAEECRARAYRWTPTADDPFEGSWVQVGGDVETALAGGKELVPQSVAASADGRAIAVGSNGYEVHAWATMKGRVEVYDLVDGAWSPRPVLEADEGGTKFGEDVALSDDGSVVAFSAPRELSDQKGVVRLFHWDGHAWTQDGADINGVAKGSLSAGGLRAVEINADASVVAVGEYYATDSGSIRVYEHAPRPTPVPTPAPTATVPTPAPVPLDAEDLASYEGEIVRLETGSNCVEVKVGHYVGYSPGNCDGQANTVDYGTYDASSANTKKVQHYTGGDLCTTCEHLEGCFGYWCDFWTGLEGSSHTCNSLNWQFGCDCDGCSCTKPPKDATESTLELVPTSQLAAGARELSFAQVDGCTWSFKLRVGTTRPTLLPTPAPASPPSVTPAPTPAPTVTPMVTPAPTPAPTSPAATPAPALAPTPSKLAADEWCETSSQCQASLFCNGDPKCEACYYPGDLEKDEAGCARYVEACCEHGLSGDAALCVCAGSDGNSSGGASTVEP